jgi:membrane protease YdiL (CAAX protease family)
VNDSISTNSSNWPTRWPKDSFKSVWTWVTVLVILAPFSLALVLQYEQGNTMPPPSAFSPLAIYATILVTLLLEGLLALIAILTVAPLSHLSLRELGFRRPTLAAVATAIGGGIVMAIVANGSASLIDALVHSRHEQEIVEIFRALHDPAAIAAFAVFAVTFAPLFEETIFRVFFFNLGLRFGGFWLGAIVSGLLFGLAHGDVIAALPLALGGIILCAVYYRTRNAFASMISHAFFNALSIVALLVAPHAMQ